MLKTRFLGSRLDQTTTTQLHKYTHPTIHLLRVSWVLNITKNSGLRGDVNESYRSRVWDSFKEKNEPSGIHNIGFAWIALKINRKYINIRTKGV